MVAYLINGLNIYLPQVTYYIEKKKLTVTMAKSIVILITPDTHEHHLHPQVKQADLVLPFEKMPKVLGVTLDTQLTFTQQCNNIAAKMQQRNNVLKALAGSTWGCDNLNLANDLPGNRPLNTQLLLLRLGAITQVH